ncbi:MAG: HD domain-containing protein [bacterium]
MAEYAEIIKQSGLFPEYEKLADFEDISTADVDTLKGLVLNIADIVGPHLDRIRFTFPQYTEHDMRHLLNVADIISRFLPKHRDGPYQNTVCLNALELTYLWLAILLHDVGMFVSEADEKQSILNSDEYKEYLLETLDRQEAEKKAKEAGLVVRAQAIREAIFAEFIRHRHAERSRAYVEKYLNGKLRFREADISPEIVNLCESHAWGVIESNDPRNPLKCVKALDISSWKVNPFC